MSIFNQNFAPNISSSLAIRQNIMARRNGQDVQRLNSRSAWIRMTSAVDIYKKTAPNPPTIESLKDKGNYDNTLSKKYILMGGVLTEQGTLKSGVGGFNNAYSDVDAYGNKLRLGIRPMPGITGIDIQSKGAYGSLREVTVNFNCWDIHQLEDLELLYMRPGYTVLIEWGWVPFINENGQYQSTVDFYDIITAPKSKEQIFKDLDAKMKKHGNYEAMFGYVKNYSWNARPDGGYDCQTSVVSIGEVVESLKINYAPSSIIDTIKNTGYLGPCITSTAAAPATQNTTVVGDIATGVGNLITSGINLVKEGLNAIPGVKNYIETDQEKMEENYSRNILAGMFYELYKISSDTIFNGAFTNTSDEGEVGTITLQPPGGKPPFTVEIFHKTININGGSDSNNGDKDVENSDEQFYISLESLCKLLNNFVVLRDKDNSKSEFVNITTKDKDGSDLLCLAHPLQVSTDPTVCLIKNMLWAEKINVTVVPVEGTTNTGTDNTNTNPPASANPPASTNPPTNTNPPAPPAGNNPPPSTNTVDAILICGLDERLPKSKGGPFKPPSEQAAIFKQGFGANKRVQVYRYDALSTDIQKCISQNPNIPIVMFSKGCERASEMALSKGADKSKIWIVEFYGISAGTTNIVQRAVNSGVPVSHVLVGPSDQPGRGYGVVKGAVPSNAPDHWSALKKVGEKIK